MASTLSFVIALAVVAGAASGSLISGERAPLGVRSNSLVVGQRQPDDRLVYQETITKVASLMGKKVIHEQTFYALRDYVITEVRALDLAEKNGAIVTLTAGGPGLEDVTLRFKSQRFHGIRFIVQVFAKLRK